MASLRFESGPRTGERIPLDRNKVTFGRSKTCDCVLPHPTVSREHFYVEQNNGKLFLVDQGSENGTFSNSERVSWIELKQGDEIQAGPFILVFEIAEGAGGFEEPHADGSPAAKHESAKQTPRESSTMRLYPPEYLEGIEHFNAGRYFDAHEVWEEVWLRSTGETKLFYQMLIQAAVGLHHYERGNSRGARGMHSNVLDKLSRLPSTLMSLDLIDFQRQFKAFLAELMENNNEARPSSDIPGPKIRLLDRDAADWSL
jgi:pSer/pThr/pTyr-binding forkhead associated (FHA) protein